MKIGISFTAEIDNNRSGIVTFVVDKESVVLKQNNLIIHNWSSEVLPNANQSSGSIHPTTPTTH